MVIRVIFSFFLLAALLSLSACKFGNKDKDKAKQSSAPQASSQQATPVSVAKVTSRKVSVIYNSVGTIESRVKPLVTARVRAHVESLAVKEGEFVKQGQLLVQLSDTEQSIMLEKAKASLYAAKSTLTEKENAMHRYGILAKKGIVSQLHFNEIKAQYETAKAKFEQATLEKKEAEIALKRTTVVAPINGYVEDVQTSEGDVVGLGTKLMRLVNHQELVAVLPFSQVKASHLKPGLPVELTTPATPNASLQETITHIQPEINAENRAQVVLVNFKNPGDWKVGASVNALVSANIEKDALLIPVNAVIFEGGNYVVFTVKNNVAKAVNVKLGYELGSEVVIKSGLTKGEEVVVHGAQYLRNGSPVKIVSQLDHQLKRKLVREESSS